MEAKKPGQNRQWSRVGQQSKMRDFGPSEKQQYLLKNRQCGCTYTTENPRQSLMMLIERLRHIQPFKGHQAS